MYWTIHVDGELVTVKPSESVSIPANPANADYQRYLAWVAEGNVAEEWTQDASD